MRNSILQSYLKKFLRSEAFVSVIIVFVLAIGIIGTSYALYMDVDTDADYQLVEVGDLSVGFDDGNNTFSLNYLTPTDDDIATNKVESDIAKEISEKNFFSFYIYNNGNYTANYDIKLVPQEGSISSEYLRYQICKDNIENCKDIQTLSEVPNNIIFNDELSPNRTESQTNPSAYYFLRVWVKNDYTPKENDKVVLKVEIDAKNASGYLDNENTLVGKLLSDDKVKINNTVPSFTGIADYVETGDESSGELGLFKAEDDYGISYYYRGAQSYNYVNFAGFTWRVVRINGDGTIRLILDGTLDKVYRKNEDGTTSETVAGTTKEYAAMNEYGQYDNGQVGYMYGFVGVNNNVCIKETAEGKTLGTEPDETSCINNNGVWTDPYDATHMNVNDNLIKTYIDSFYEMYIKNDNYGFDKYLADSIFCADKTTAIHNEGYDTGLGYGTGITYYSANKRLYKENSIVEATPTLKCTEGVTNDYSRYTVDKKTVNGVELNGDLKYPIALLSADELLMAGAWGGKGTTVNKTFYLYNEDTMTSSWWTMTPLIYQTGLVGVFHYDADELSLGKKDLVYRYDFGVRPVINLKADVLYKTGDGTSKTPYEIK